MMTILVAVSQTRRAINTSLLAANYGTTWHNMAQHGTTWHSTQADKHNTAEQHKHRGKKPYKLPCLQSGLQCSDTAPLIVDFVFRHQPPFHYSRGPPNISLHRRPGGKPFLIHLPARTCWTRLVSGRWVRTMPWYATSAALQLFSKLHFLRFCFAEEDITRFL